jgi:C-terminal processing protease CtpA/Prc
VSKYRTLWLAAPLLALSALYAFHPLSAQQGMDKINLDRARVMLHDAYDLVKKEYYDPKIRGLDWDARFHDHDEKIKSATSLGQAFGVIAGFLDGLHDSHTFFRPPSRQTRVEYGYRMQVFGDDVFITRVRPRTDAESKVHIGDQVMQYNKYRVGRDDMWKISYYYRSLAPQSATQLDLRDPAGQARQVIVQSEMHVRKKVMDLTSRDSDDFWQMIREEENADHLVRQRYVEAGDVMIWKMPEFFLNDHEVDRLFDIARKRQTLILDLRGNPGGAVVTLERMLGNVFDHDLKIADRVGRKELKPQLAKTRGGNTFTGKIIVLVDSGSASASELFARVIQLEKRGQVIGDRTSGSVMEAKAHSCSQGADVKIFYSFSVTDADLTMKDGKSLEHTGVVPDEVVIPTAQDLAEGRDPALSRAAALAGINIDSVAAGKLFPFEWIPL